MSVSEPPPAAVATPRPPVVLAVDGNSLLHRAFHANARTGFRGRDGRPLWAVQGLLAQIVSAVDRACADAVIVGFDDPDSSVRRDRWPHYKAQRPDKLANLECQLREAPEVVAGLGIPVVVPQGLEADDVLASVATTAPAWGATCVLATSDRDAFALIDQNTRVLRLINGGAGASPMLTAERLQLLTGVAPHQYPDFAALRGDPADNLPGVSGVGKVIAARLLARFGTAERLFTDAATGGSECLRVVGPALVQRLARPETKAAWVHNREVMAMRSDVTLPWQAQDLPQQLPLDPGRVGPVYSRFDLGTRQALRILCDVEDPAPHLQVVRDSPAGSHAAPRPRPVQPHRLQENPRDSGATSDPRAIRPPARREPARPAAVRQLTLFS